MSSADIQARRWLLAAVALLVVAGGKDSHAADAGAAAPAGDLKKLVKDGDRAAARRDWDEAVSDYGEAAKIAPGDARLRDKLRRALDRRARAREARAADPPPTPQPIPPMFGGHSDSLDVLSLRDRHWHKQLAREALEARADAEAARLRPDGAKIARLRERAAELRKDEDRLASQLARQKSKDEATAAKNEKEMEKAFEGVGGLGIGGQPQPQSMKDASP